MKKAALLLCFLLCAAFVLAEEQPQQPTLSKREPSERAFAPGEKLTYSLSWSNFVNVGSAVMEVQTALDQDGKDAYRLVCFCRSEGMLETLFPVRVEAMSLVSAADLRTISFSLKNRYGNKERRRALEFDHVKHTVVYRPDEDPPETHAVPKHIQDSLSSLYYVRTKNDFVVGKIMTMVVFEKGKTWSLDVHTLGRERITTPLGEFDTIKIQTHPLYEGVFPNKGAIDIWLTDDARKIPVLMKSKVIIAKVGVGSVVATLTKIEPNKKEPDAQERPQKTH